MTERFRGIPPRLHTRDGVRLFVAPSPPLAPYIAHYTLMFAVGSHPPAGALSLIPDASGCLVVTVDERRADASFWGATTKAVSVPNAPVPIYLFVEFRPGGAASLTGLRQPDWTDQRAALALADRALDDELTAALEQSRDVSAQIAALDALFLRRAAQFAQPRGPALAQAVARSGAQRVRDAASYWGYSERQLGRLFGEMLGLRVKTYLRLLSVNRILKYAYHNRGSLAALAQEAGYFD